MHVADAKGLPLRRDLLGWALRDAQESTRKWLLQRVRSVPVSGQVGLVLLPLGQSLVEKK